MIDYIEALREEEDIEFVLVGHETTAAFMAGVCGRLTGVPGVCFGTFGPGATNLATGVGGALLDRFPMIAFTDEMPENLRNRTVQMNIDHQALFQPITKWTTRLGKENVSETILKAAGITIAEPPGSVHIGVPAGIGLFRSEEAEKKLNYLRLEKKLKQQSKNEEGLQKARQLFVEAKRPLLVSGLSAVRAGAQQTILQMAEKFELPVVLTPMAKGMFPENHPLYTGVLFHALSDIVSQTYSEADLIVGVGYDPVEFNYEEWMPRVPLIHLDNQPADVDRDEVGEIVSLEGDPDMLLKELLLVSKQKKSWDRNILVKRKEELFHQLQPKSGSLDPRAVVAGLREALPEEGILTVDVGAHLHLVGQQWYTPSPEKLLMTNGWSSMGFALPAALAAKICNPKIQVACLSGDGGFLMNAGELATAKRLKLNIVFVIINDNSLSLIRIKQERKNFNSNYGTPLELTDITSSTQIFGVPVIRVTTRTSYEEALKKAFAAESPVVIEAIIDGSEYDNLVLKPNR
jgi:acetolactate synthase-1/2/3 large subunit